MQSQCRDWFPDLANRMLHRETCIEESDNARIKLSLKQNEDVSSLVFTPFSVTALNVLSKKSSN